MLYSVTSHTCHVGPGSTFVSCKSFSSHAGSEQRRICLIEEAIERGATKIVVEKSLRGIVSERDGVSFLFVDDCRKALAQLSSMSLGDPSHKLKIIGITGTKGKTTTSFLVEHVLRSVGFKTGLLGSVKNKILDDEVASSLTTPESDDLHMFFHQCVSRGVTHVVMEVSSHAIAFSRVHGVPFSFIGFTNLAPEHMDFHPTMEDYFSTKTRLFSQLSPSGCVVINGDDAWGRKAASLVDLIHPQVELFHNGDSFTIERSSFDGLSLSVDDCSTGGFNPRIKIPSLFGKFNAYNVAMAFFLCRQVGCARDEIASALETFPGIPGRLQMHQLSNGARAFVDFAHNPSSFEAVLQALRPLTKRLIVLFGCGGDRDKTKRPEMGRLAALYGDQIIVTSDNPRSEDPETIIQEIYAGVSDEKRPVTTCILDRKTAIRQAVECSGDGAVIALLGKGHEKQYLCKGKKYLLDDFEEICQF